MTTIFHASNGLHLDQYGRLVSSPDGRNYTNAELRAARLEWAQDALTPKLPTEPGLYFDTNEDSWYLTSWGKWWNCTVFEDEYIWREVNSATDPANYLPFTTFEEHRAVKGK